MQDDEWMDKYPGTAGETFNNVKVWSITPMHSAFNLSLRKLEIEIRAPVDIEDIENAIKFIKRKHFNAD